MDGVWQRLHGGDHDAVARMDAERVDILHGADGNAGVLGVAHHLVFDLLPANEAALDHHLTNRAGAQATLHALPVLLFGSNDAAARATEREGGANDGGETDLRERRLCSLHALVVVCPVHHGARRCGLPNAIAHLAEELAILRHLDCREWRSEEANWMSLEDTGIIERHRHVECRLSAESGKQPLRLLALDDALDHLDGEWLEVDNIGDRRVGHDCRRIGVHENRTDPFGTQRATSLCSRVIKLGGLTNHYRSRADDQNARRFGAHRSLCAIALMKRSKTGVASSGPGEPSG